MSAATAAYYLANTLATVKARNEGWTFTYWMPLAEYDKRVTWF